MTRRFRPPWTKPTSTLIPTRQPPSTPPKKPLHCVSSLDFPLDLPLLIRSSSHLPPVRSVSPVVCISGTPFRLLDVLPDTPTPCLSFPTNVVYDRTLTHGCTDTPTPRKIVSFSPFLRIQTRRRPRTRPRTMDPPRPSISTLNPRSHPTLNSKRRVSRVSITPSTRPRGPVTHISLVS